MRLAQTLSERGTPAVPVFWLATEDHDFAEVNHVWSFDYASHEPFVLRVDAPGDLNGRQRPVGNLVMEHPPVDQLARSLPGFEHGEEVAAAVRKAYPPGVTFGAGFKALLKDLLGKFGLLFLDPLDPAVRQIGAPTGGGSLGGRPRA